MDEFCSICGEPIEEFDLFWLRGIERIDKYLSSQFLIEKVCIQKECHGEARYSLLLENDFDRIYALEKKYNFVTKALNIIENKAWT